MDEAGFSLERSVEASGMNTAPLQLSTSGTPGRTGGGLQLWPL